MVYQAFNETYERNTMHKHAWELKKGDRFLMAGGLYIIQDVYELDTEEFVKFRATAVGGNQSLYLQLPHTLLLHLY